MEDHEEAQRKVFRTVEACLDAYIRSTTPGLSWASLCAFVNFIGVGTGFEIIEFEVRQPGVFEVLVELDKNMTEIFQQNFPEILRSHPGFVAAIRDEFLHPALETRSFKIDEQFTLDYLL